MGNTTKTQSKQTTPNFPINPTNLTNPWETKNAENIYFEVNPCTKIISFSDIHADIHSLIVALRDCGKVIRKRTQFNQEKKDDELEKYLNVNLNNLIDLNEEEQQKKYPDDLGYEWIGKSTIVVIVGDILDGKRMNDKRMLIKRNNKMVLEHEYPQIELKILKFINALNAQAMNNTFKSRIFKLLGNHEVMNFASEAKNYIFNNDMTNLNYYNKMKRNSIFNYGRYGHKLLFKDGCWSILMINKYIFVHGQILESTSKRSVKPDFNYYTKLNNDINSHDSKLFYNAVTELSQASNSFSSQLWKRDYGNSKKTSERYEKIIQKVGLNTDENDDKFKNAEYESDFCKNEVVFNFDKFLSGSGLKLDTTSQTIPTKKYNSDDLIIVIGHCPQYIASESLKEYATTINELAHEDKITQTFSGKTMNGKFDGDNNLIFGITMECPLYSHNDNWIKSNPTTQDNNKYKVYKVDVGSSRGFDEMQSFDWILKNNSNLAEKNALFARTPQIILFEGNNVSIIKSQMKNTRIHQHREIYEKMIADKYDETNPDGTPKYPFDKQELNLNNSKYYKEKYLKYKQKYIQLKKSHNI